MTPTPPSLSPPGRGLGAIPLDDGPSPDLRKEAPHTAPCPACSAPVEDGDAFCPNCGGALRGGTPSPPSTTSNAAPSPSPLVDRFRCENCGAEVRCEAGQRATRCPFCAAPYVVDLGRASTSGQDPEFVLGFAIPPDRADRIYRQWIAARAWFRPKDLAIAAEAEAIRGIYLPFWSFSARADSRWSARIGEDWQRTEHYWTTDDKGNQVSRTRQVTETEWWPLEGGHHAFYSFYLVSGSKGLPQEVFEWILPYQLGALKRYRAGYLAGWLCEDTSVGRDSAYERTAEELHRRETESIAAFLPGDRHSGLEVETRLSDPASDLILLPLYLLSYRYRGTLYRTLINGQTGKIEGEKPVSPARIGLMVAALLILVALVVLSIARLSR